MIINTMILLFNGPSSNYLDNVVEVKKQLILDLPRIDLVVNNNKIDISKLNDSDDTGYNIIYNYWVNHLHLPSYELRFLTQAVFAPAIEILMKMMSKNTLISQHSRVCVQIIKSNYGAIIKNSIILKANNRYFNLIIITKCWQSYSSTKVIFDPIKV